MKKSSNSIKYGDAFRLGENLLLCGDCRDKELVSKLIGNQKIKAVVCDPPYGVAVTESKQNFQALSNPKMRAPNAIQKY